MFVAIILFFSIDLLLLFILAVSGLDCVTRDLPLRQAVFSSYGGRGGILAPRPGIEPTLLALEGEVFTGLPGKSCGCFF